jgi:hypothetical protein
MFRLLQSPGKKSKHHYNLMMLALFYLLKLSLLNQPLLVRRAIRSIKPWVGPQGIGTAVKRQARLHAGDGVTTTRCGDLPLLIGGAIRGVKPWIGHQPVGRSVKRQARLSADNGIAASGCGNRPLLIGCTVDGI